MYGKFVTLEIIEMDHMLVEPTQSSNENSLAY